MRIIRGILDFLGVRPKLNVGDKALFSDDLFNFTHYAEISEVEE
jgi:hypothetical protein